MDQQQQEAATGNETAGQAEQQQTEAPTVENQGDWTQPLDAGKEESKDPIADIMPKKPEDAGGKKDAPKAEERKGEADKPLEVTFPEGYQHVDEESMSEFQAIAKEFNIPQEKAQKLADIYVAGQKKQMDLFNTEHVRLTQRIDQQWRQEIAADPEVGGGNYEASRNYAISAIRRFVPDKEQAAFLDFYRNANLHNNPHLFKFLVRVGKGTGEAGPALADKGGEVSDKDPILADKEAVLAGTNQ